ncbi:MAG: GFA family protein [Rhodospirillales bacterium]|nr:GFA family protein [Rhodospirillales bacterium]
MKIDGGCHCGHITFEAEIDPETVGICHCTDCQVMSGSPYSAVVQVAEENFRLLTGALKIYVKTAESGNRRPQMFCPNCGNRIYATSEGDGPKRFGVRLGIIRQKADLTPKRQIWTRSALPWVNDLDAIPAVETQPDVL